ncbi:hypothetical protein L6452_06994 [Arctium lappa]|uniref:Uncharacterized protein n=1 Tax=Arctium lappa TaxID=4217 RepID=A0ACB9EKS8_ARCLA|nr:hypothetical protein L6452_06994 [Arctium lappa]
MNDPGIILFGKKIGLPETAKISNLPPSNGGHHGLEETTNREMACSSIYRHLQTSFTPHDDLRKDVATPEDEMELDDNPKTPSVNEEGMPEKPQTTTGTEGDTANSQPKTLKKPDKLLPCPRCDSINTKFCYYNNSNINQPRHFCKSCQRYWTAGGTMRNMPVGAGRRKKKNPPSHCRFIISQEAFGSPAAPQIEFVADSDVVHNGIHPTKVLSFGPNSPQVGANLSVASGRVGENGDDCSSGSTVITSNSVVDKIQDNNGFHSQVHWIPGASWSYNPWNTAIPMPIPAICPPGYPPMPIYPSPYWSSVPWLHPATSATNFSILGKHSTDGEEIKPNEEPKRQKNSVLIPKTLRIDDPDEAAKSSIWETLGIKKENSSKGNLFKAFQAKGDEKKKHPATEPSPLLQANPAAFSRSLCFQERA